MSTLGEIISELRTALGELPDDAVQGVRKHLVDDLLPRLEGLASGTSQASRLTAARQRLAAVPAELDRVRSLLHTVRTHTEEWITQCGGAVPASAPPS